MTPKLYRSSKGLIPFNPKQHGLVKSYVVEDYSLILFAGEEVAAIHRSRKYVILQSIDQREFYLAEVAPPTQKEEPDMVITCARNKVYHGIEQREIDGTRRIICVNLVGVVEPGLVTDGDGDEYEGKIVPYALPSLKDICSLANSLIGK